MLKLVHFILIVSIQSSELLRNIGEMYELNSFVLKLMVIYLFNGGYFNKFVVLVSSPFLLLKSFCVYSKLPSSLSLSSGWCSQPIWRCVLSFLFRLFFNPSLIGFLCFFSFILCIALKLDYIIWGHVHIFANDYW